MSKTWFITGASSGLGREMAERLLTRGDRIVATIRRNGVLADLEHKHGDALVVATLDVTDTNGIRTIVDEAFRRMGRIDVIVSNAGYGLFGAAEELKDAQIDHQIATNLTGSIQFIRTCLPYLRRQGGGRIVQVSSEGGQVAYPSFSLYHATKWGIEGFVEAVAQEVAPFGIDFMIAEPGPTATNFGANVVSPAPMEIYEETPAGAIRRAISGGSFAIRGQAGRTAEAMIAAADLKEAPFRLPLGRTAFEHVTGDLSKRLVAVEALRELALSAD
ncbi:SDR family oxidoreductase [Allorhizobium sp. BGMRC 0089]|uniref:SDR family oxidoreductase n=1 Tax=Allorhizobium sonneratiae TaxID=2934936 RepID=UPI0020339E52|nr:SDR family oxidoreductase [Allorhizobium sonneratiae]MCM2292561.1 SDR family oxidoreductase [Allorhizobium sonneratiae]